MTKQELRKAYLEKRRLLNEEEYKNLNRLLSEAFFQNIDLSAVSILHCFLPILKNHEPNTRTIIDHIQKSHPIIKVVVPRVNQDGQIESYLFDERQLEINSWGIPEPKGGSLIAPQLIDMILVPLLAFDKKGHRVGYGKGYYDRFLKDCRIDSKKIGLSFFPPEEKIADINKDDFPLDKIVTPKKVFNFSNNS